VPGVVVDFGAGAEALYANEVPGLAIAAGGATTTAIDAHLGGDATGLVATVAGKLDATVASSTYSPAAVVSAPTGVSATDCANFAAAHATLPATGGKIVLQRGAYDFTAGVTISKPCIVEGAGGPDAGWTNCPTLVVCTSPTATAITKTTHGIVLRDFGVKYTGGTTPTAGAGVHSTGGPGVSGDGDRFENFGINGFYVCHIKEGGYEYSQSNFSISDPVKWGESWIGVLDFTHSAGSFVAGPVNLLPEAMIHAEVAGGVKLGLFKMNNRPGGGTYECGVDVVMTDGFSNEDWIISNASIEGYSIAAIRVRNAGPANTGTLIRLQILGVQVSGVAAALSRGISLEAATLGGISEVIIDDCIFESTIPVVATNVHHLSIGINTYHICAEPYLVATTCTGVQQGVGWVSNAASATVDTTESTSSTAWTDLTTVGPSATADIGPSRKCLVITTAEILAPSAGVTAYMTPIFTGPSWTSTPITSWGIMSTAAGWTKVSNTQLVTAANTFNEGTETFTAKYAVDSGSGSFRRRSITVIPL